MAKFLITLRLQSNLQRMVENENEDAAVNLAYREAKDLRLALIGDGWEEPLTIDVLDVEEIKNGN